MFKKFQVCIKKGIFCKNVNLWSVLKAYDSQERPCRDSLDRWHCVWDTCALTWERRVFSLQITMQAWEVVASWNPAFWPTRAHAQLLRTRTTMRPSREWKRKRNAAPPAPRGPLTPLPLTRTVHLSNCPARLVLQWLCTALKIPSRMCVNTWQLLLISLICIQVYPSMSHQPTQTWIQSQKYIKRK